MTDETEIKCGVYYVETRMRVSHIPEALRWTSADVFKVVLRNGEHVAGKHYFPWQAEEAAIRAAAPGYGNPEIVDGIREIRVRCERPAQGVPMGPFTLGLPSTTERPDPPVDLPDGTPGKPTWPEVTSDGRMWRWEADPDPEGTQDFQFKCEATGQPLHPIHSLRRFADGVDLDQADAEEPEPDETPEPEAKEEPQKRKPKRAPKGKAKPAGAMF